MAGKTGTEEVASVHESAEQFTDILPFGTGDDQQR